MNQSRWSPLLVLALVACAVTTQADRASAGEPNAPDAAAAPAPPPSAEPSEAQPEDAAAADDPASAPAAPAPTASADPPEAEPAGAEDASGDAAASTHWTVEPSMSTAPARDTADEPSSVAWQLVGGLITWGVGAGVLVAFHYAFFRLNDVVRDDDMKAYRAGVPAGESSCARARDGVPSNAADAPSPEAIVDLCDEADSMEVLRNVALPIGVVTAVLGIVLIGTSDTVNPTEARASARTWDLQVGMGPQGGGASATVRFW